MGSIQVTVSIHIPDETDQVALFNITPEGEASIIGYIRRSLLEQLLYAAKDLQNTYDNWLRG